MTCGALSSNRGFNIGSFGSLSPSDFKGELINKVAGAESGLSAIFELDDEFLAAGFWNFVRITGVFDSGQATVIWDRIGDGFGLVQVGGISQWTDTSGRSDPGMVTNNVYDVTIS